VQCIQYFPSCMEEQYVNHTPQENQRLHMAELVGRALCHTIATRVGFNHKPSQQSSVLGPYRCSARHRPASLIPTIHRCWLLATPPHEQSQVDCMLSTCTMNGEPPQAAQQHPACKKTDWGTAVCTIEC